MRFIIKFYRELAALISEIYEPLSGYINVAGFVIAIVTVVSAARAPELAVALLALLALGALVILAIAGFRSLAPEPAPPPQDVREFQATSYKLSSDTDMTELSKLALAMFGQTFPDSVDTSAVRGGCALGLRLATMSGHNIGFLDAYHFRADVLEEWRFGNLNELTMTADHFAAIPSIANGQEINLVVGALYIDAPGLTGDRGLASALVTAGWQYLNAACSEFAKVNLYATIFKEAGRAWAEKKGFKMDIPRDKRGKAGGEHDLYVLQFVPSKTPPQEVVEAFGSRYEYHIHLRV
jgi:hypothetical protein